MRKTQRFVAIALSLLAVAGGFAAWRLWQSQQTAALLRAAVPEPPDLSSWPDEFGQKVRQATAAARENRPAGWLAELARLYLANGFKAEAAAVLRGLERLQPGEARWVYYRAELQQMEGNNEEARRLWDETLELEPGYAPAHLKLGELLLKQGRLAEAASHYEQRLRLVPGDPYARLGLARVALQQNDQEAARQRLEGLVSDHPTFPSGLNLLAEIEARAGNEQKAGALRRRGHRAGLFREAPDPWREELRDFFYDPQQLLVFASILEQTARLEEALPYLEKAVRLAPENGAVYEGLGAALILLERHEEAREVLDRGLAVDPDEPSLYFTLMLALRGLGRPELGVEVLERGVRRLPEHPEMHNRLGVAYETVQMTAAAMSAYRKALELDANHVEARVNLGKSLVAQGRPQEGEREIERALEIEPRDTNALIYLTGREIDADKLERADEHLTTLERLKPGEPEVRQLRAFWYLRRGRAAAVAGRTEEAMRDFVAGAKVDPTVGDLHGNIGVILAQQGRFNEAATAFARFVSASPQETTAYIYLGGALARAGRMADARKALDAGLGVAQELDDEEAVRQITELLARVEDE